MSYNLNATKILYQTSKYAPVAVVQLELEAPAGESFRLSHEQINAGLHQISVGSGGGPLSLSSEVSPVDIYCELALELQRYALHLVRYSQAKESKTDNSYRVYIEYEDPATALYAGELAADLLNAILENPGGMDARLIGELQQMLEEYVGFAFARLLDPNVQLLLKAARRKGIPFLYLDPPWNGPTLPQAITRSVVIQFGWGINQRRCLGSMPLDFTPQENLPRILDRAQFLQRLGKASLPLAGQDLEFINRNQVTRAQRSARRIGYPVTLRPRMAIPAQYRSPDNHVFGPLHGDAEVALVASYLKEEAGADIWVESYIESAQYRFLVLNNEVLSVIRCAPPTLTGDGVHKIAELASNQATAALNTVSHRVWQTMAQGDSSVVFRLQLAGLSLDSVPASGEQIVLRGFGTLYNGGSCEDMTKDMPPHFGELAVQVAELSGIGHLAGVDVNIGELPGAAVIPNCAVTGVDPAPDLQVHGLSSEKDPHHIGDKYLAQLFPADRPPRIPTVAVTGTNGKTTTCRMVTRILQTADLKVGLACTDGLYLEDELLVKKDAAGTSGAANMLMDLRVEAAVMETARGGLATRGIAFDHCDVGACLNVTEDHLGEDGIETLDDMAVHKRQVIERATGAVVLNAEDPLCLAMRGYAIADEVILIANNMDHPAIKAHCQAGGKAIVIVPTGTAGEICIMDRTVISPLLKVNEIPATWDGTAPHNVQNAMFAIGIALGLKIEPQVIRNALASFSTSIDVTPGRLNLFDALPFKVLIDYAHNAHSYEALCQCVQQLAVPGKRTLIVYSAQRQDDEERKRIAETVAGKFDEFICRGRHGSKNSTEVDTTPYALRAALLAAGVAETAVEVVSDINEAVEFALLTARAGDLIVVSATGRYRMVWDQLAAFQEGKLLSDSASSGQVAGG